MRKMWLKNLFEDKDLGLRKCITCTSRSSRRISFHTIVVWEYWQETKRREQGITREDKEKKYKEIKVRRNKDIK